jgi:3-methyladenine DNA glycosylase AlkC
MEPLKEIYNHAFINTLIQDFCTIEPGLHSNEIRKNILTADYEYLELKQRMSHIAKVIAEALNPNYKIAAKTLKKFIQLKTQSGPSQSFQYLFLPEIIIQHGMKDLKTSISLMESLSMLTSCEFAVRHFMIQYPDEMLKQMLVWTQHPHEYLRRFASEGTRPKLPWGLALQNFITDPSPIIPILQALKNDESEYVTKSVSNSINDISKNHPQLVLNLLKKWSGNTDVRVLKHAARTLLKSGNAEALKVFGLHKHQAFELESFNLTTTKVKINSTCEFQCEISNSSKSTAKLRLEYAIYFLNNNGKHFKKVFKISEREIAAKEKIIISKKHSFKQITTRKYYPGKQYVSIIINGKESSSKEFFLSIQ